MYYESIAGYDPLVFDIVQQYAELRRGKMGREEAIRQIEEECSNELSDTDTAPVVRIGLAMALCQKKELTRPVQEKAMEAFRTLIEQGEWGEEGNAVLRRGMARVAQEAMLGEEAGYRPRKIYAPDWKIGDTFSHVITDPLAAELGIMGWYFLLRKVGEVTDREGRVGQLVYVNLCPPDSMPKTGEELNGLKYLRADWVLSLTDKRHEYLFEMKFRNRKDVERCDLKRIGCFPDIRLPVNRKQDEPPEPYFLSVSFNLKGTDIPHYERELVVKYRFKGTEP